MALDRATQGLYGNNPDIMSLLQQQYGTAAPASQAFVPVSQGAQISADPQSLAGFATRFPKELAQLGWTGGDPVVYDYTPGGESGQDFRATPVGVKPEFEQFLQGKNLQMAMEPTGSGSRVTLLAGGQPIGQYQETQSKFERFMNQFQPLAVNAILGAATGGALNAAFGLFGVSSATASALSRALAPSVMQLAVTGKASVDQAARNLLVNFFGPTIGAETAAQVQDLYGQATGKVLPAAVERAVSNAAASAAATAIQQGADRSDIGRNTLAGMISSAVATTLNSAGVDASVSAGIGRSAGSYVSTGNAAQAIVDGVTRGLTFEQQKQALQQERAAKQAEKAESARETGGLLSRYPAPDAGGASIANSSVAQESGALQAVGITGQAGAGAVSPADIQAEMQRQRGPAPQIPVTGAKQPSPDEPIAATGQQGVAAGQLIGAPGGQIEIAGRRPIDVTGTPIQAGDIESQVLTPGQTGRIDITGQRPPPQITVTGQRPGEVPEGGVISPGQVGKIDVTGQRPPQEITVTGRPIGSPDIISDVPRIPVTGQRPAQQITVVGRQPAAEDIIDYTAEPEPREPEPKPEPSQEPVFPTDIFSFVKRGTPSGPSAVARLASMDYPMGRTVGTGGFTPAGELEPGGSTKPRQPVWNEASLRLKDALGL